MAVDDKTVIDCMQEMRPTVQRFVLEDFLAGRSPQTQYLTVSADEFRKIVQAAYDRGIHPDAR
ncbi:MAG: hypothetical protein F8N39_11485 [Clostridiaceae bacterium]|nr:hypothetical protein [Clostridiaceae bacterium]